MKEWTQEAAISIMNLNPEKCSLKKLRLGNYVIITDSPTSLVLPRDWMLNQQCDKILYTGTPKQIHSKLSVIPASIIVMQY